MSTQEEVDRLLNILTKVLHPSHFLILYLKEKYDERVFLKFSFCNIATVNPTVLRIHSCNRSCIGSKYQGYKLLPDT